MKPPAPRTVSRRGVLAAAGLLPVAALTDCSALTPGSSAKQSKPTHVSTTVPKQKVTLRLAYADEPPTKELIQGFQKHFPQVTIKPEFTQFNSYVKSIKLSMSSDSSPDIAEYNPGAMRALIPAGLVLDLDAYSSAYHWSDSFPESGLAILRSDKSAKRYDTGSLYATPAGMSIVGVYYNKKLAAKAGITAPPKTFAQFESALAKAKSHGLTPLEVGGLDVGGLHLWAALQNTMTPVEQYRNWVFGAPGSTIELPGAKRAAQKVLDWSRRGYISKSANGTSEADATTKFAQGASVFTVTGNWSASTLGKAMGGNVGFFVFPGSTASSAPVASGASVAYSISAKTKHADVAAAFLNYMSSTDAAKIQAAAGFEPVNVHTPLSPTGVNAAIIDGFKSVVSGNGAGILPFPDFAAPKMLDALGSGTQALLGGKKSAEAFLRSLQEIWTGYHGK